MNKHFSYLTSNSEADFFQKLAEDAAGSRTPRASAPFAKTASAPAARPRLGQRVERDLAMLKTAGDCGLSLGMTKRAMAYIDDLTARGALPVEEMAEVFEKVSAAAIMEDLTAVHEHLAPGLNADGLAWLETALAKVGHDLTRAALFDKEAAGLVGKVVDKVKGLVAGAMKAPAAVQQAATRISGAATKAGEPMARARSVARNIKELDAVKDVTARFKAGASVKPPPKPVIDLDDVGVPKMPSKPAASAATTAPPVAPPRTPSAASPGATPPKMKELAAPAAADDAAKAADNAADNAADAVSEVTLKGAYTKVRDQGWKSLSGEEKQKLINAGVATIVGGRVVLGHGILTGSDGIV